MPFASISKQVYRPILGDPSGLVMILALLVCSFAWSEDLPPAAEGWRKLDKEAPVWIDQEQSRVVVEGKVVLREGVLEMFACPEGTKEHEAIVAVPAPAFLVHTALLAIGAEPGKPVKYVPKYQPPSGDQIEVTIEWVATGETRTTRAQDWIRYADTERPMDLPFVFAGSGFWTDPRTGQQHYQAEGGELICVSNFGAAMLDVPAESTQANEGLLFEPFTDRIPPVDTPVRLYLAVTKPMKKASEAVEAP